MSTLTRSPACPCQGPCCLSPVAAALQDPASRKRMNNETRVSLAVASGFEAAHYLNAQKIRTRMEKHFRWVYCKKGLVAVENEAWWL